MARLDLTGRIFGRLTVLHLEPGCDHEYIRWVCRCECGTVKPISRAVLRRGSTKSCGCFAQEVRSQNGKNNRTHGESKTVLYAVWRSMCSRCDSPKHTHFKYYGGRGIKIAEEWRDYLNFKDWAMSRGYQRGLTIDRKNNDGDYSPSNCRWVTPTENANNTRKNVFVEIDGISLSFMEASRKYQIFSKVARDRISKLGWSVEEAFKTPARRMRKK